MAVEHTSGRSGQLKESAANASLIGQIADEFLQRLEAGEQPRVEEYAERHPEAATELRQVLAALVLLDRSSASSSQGSLATPPLVDGILGDYRLGREIGRGGMGVVYEAEQISLKRRVALKVLPLAGLLDDQLLKRFHNEALAAASLAHPHIVSIYNVGCERGTHYYAMQFVDGLSLDKVIAGLRAKHTASPLWGEGRIDPSSPSPQYSGERAGVRGEAISNADTSPIALLSTAHSGNKASYFRRVAELGAQAAEALQYAHDVGIVHRDIKPANLLLDKQGKLWIADFGLARIEGAGDLTQTGDLIGTCRYMSPEQARGERASVDHRTDIYSLGVTLYELLALRPALSGKSREEVLKQLSQERPTALRKLESSLPRDLETIVFKAIAHDPADRYKSAADLAQDLRSFLQQLPIRARPYTLLQRTRSWVRRHPGAMLTAVFSLAVVTAAMSVAALIAGSALDKAEKSRQETNEHKADLLLSLYVADMPEAQRLWMAGDLDGALELLRRHIPRSPEEADHRGIEWHYLWRICNQRPRVTQAHDRPINAVAVSANGNWAATGDDHGWTKIWQLPNLEPVAATSKHWDGIRLLAFVSDDRELLSVGADGTMFVWNPLSGRRIRQITGQPGKILAAALSPDGLHLATADFDLRLRTWSIASGELEYTSPECPAHIHVLTYDQNGATLFGAEKDGPVQAVMVGADKLGPRSERIEGTSTLITTDVAAQLICCTRGGNITSLPFPTLQYRGYQAAHGAEMTAGDNVPMQAAIATGGRDNCVKLWELEGPEKAVIHLRRVTPVPQDIPWSIRFSQDGRYLACGTANGKLLMSDNYWNGAHHCKLQGKLADRPEEITLSLNCSLAVSSSTTGIIQLWNAANGTELSSFSTNLEDDDHCVRISPNGDELIVGAFGRGGGVQVWDIADPTAPKQIAQPAEVAAAKYYGTYSNHGRWFAFNLPSSIAIWDCETQKVIKQWPCEKSTSLAFSPNDRYLAASSEAGELTVFDTHAGDAVVNVSTSRQGWHCLSISPDSRLLAVGSGEGVDVYDFPTLHLRKQLRGPAMSTTQLRFSPDGKTLVSAHPDLRFWNVATWREVLQLNLLDQDCGDMQFTPDGRKLVIAGYPGQVTTFSLDEE